MKNWLTGTVPEYANRRNRTYATRIESRTRHTHKHTKGKRPDTALHTLHTRTHQQQHQKQQQQQNKHDQRNKKRCQQQQIFLHLPTLLLSQLSILASCFSSQKNKHIFPRNFSKKGAGAWQEAVTRKLRWSLPEKSLDLLIWTDRWK